MIALVIVVNRIELLEDLIEEFRQNKIYCGTMFDSIGMASISEFDGLMGSFRGAFNKSRPFNKTLLMLLPESEIPIAQACVRKILGDLSLENVGIMFTMPVASFEGIRRVE